MTDNMSSLVLVQQEIIEQLRQERKLWKRRTLWSCDNACLKIPKWKYNRPHYDFQFQCSKCYKILCDACPNWGRIIKCSRCPSGFCPECAVGRVLRICSHDQVTNNCSICWKFAYDCDSCYNSSVDCRTCGAKYMTLLYEYQRRNADDPTTLIYKCGLCSGSYQIN